MAEASAEPAYNTLSDFLDTLPTQPCKSPPVNRYYCTVCARLKKPVAIRCEYSKYKGEGIVTSEGSDDTIQFIQLQDEQAGAGSGKFVEPSTELGKVEFKVVAPMKADDDYPLIELVQPKDKKIEPIEMELLEDVAIEFEVSEEEPMEVEAFEVAPIDEFDEEDEVEEVGSGMEVEAIEAEPIEAMEDDLDLGELENFPEFKPLEQQPSPTQAEVPSMIRPSVAKGKPKIKAKKKSKKGPIKKSVGVPKKTIKKPIKKSPKKPIKKHGKITPTAKKPMKKTAPPKMRSKAQPPRRMPQKPAQRVSQGATGPTTTSTKRMVIVKKMPKA